MDRIKILQSHLEKEEAVFITSYANRLYYSGFASSAGAVVITKTSAWLLIDFRYYEKAAKVVTACDVILLNNFADQVRALCGQTVKAVYVETGQVCLDRFRAWKRSLPEYTFLDEDKIQKAILHQRSMKSSREIANMQAAQQITDETFSYILPRIQAGRTEREIMLDMEFFMRKNGSEGVAFDSIVVSGKNTSLPHGVPTDKVIETGDLVTMDFGAVCNGYRSDMTRTVAVGRIGQEEETVYQTVLAAQEAAFSCLKPGAICREVDRAARDLISRAGYDGRFGHGLGHSVGLEIHENPACNTSCETVLQSGTVMTVEPGIYLPDRFGVRIEDMVVIRENGFENFTKSAKNLMIL